MANFQGNEWLVKISLCKIQDVYVSYNFTKFERYRTYGYRKKLRANCPFKIHVMCRYHGNRGNDNIFLYNMRSFIQAHKIPPILKCIA